MKSLNVTASVRCPTCGQAPVLVRYQTRFWRAKCPVDHLTKIASTPMSSKRKALDAWNAENSKPNNVKQKSSP